MRTFNQLESFAAMAADYRRERRDRPTARAIDVWRWLNSDGYETFDQFICSHHWTYSDTDRCYCLYCGADGDA